MCMSVHVVAIQSVNLQFNYVAPSGESAQDKIPKVAEEIQRQTK